MIEEYIEDVQMELAKAVIEDKLPIKKMEVEFERRRLVDALAKGFQVEKFDD